MSAHNSRKYQVELYTGVESAWAANDPNVLGVMPTGAGKTHVSSRVIERSGAPFACMAHRTELVGQMSIALGREGIRHTVVGAKTLGPQIARLHMEELGRSFYDVNSPYSVCSVQTVARLADNDPVFSRTRGILADEAHHYVPTNAFGKALMRFHPSARILGVTATPCRADGLSLGRAFGGLFNRLVEGPSLRTLIDAGYLTDYRIVVAPSDIKLDSVRHSADGDYNQNDLRQARRESRITGDVVKQYLKWAPGKLNVVFDVDIQSATATAAAFRAAGVPAEVLSGDMDPFARAAALRRFRAREILVLVTVDLVSEGFDLPAIEVVQFARPTDSYVTFAQQFGRVLRLMIRPELMAMWEDFSPARRLELIAQSLKPLALIIDHVGNVVRHGLPDARSGWDFYPSGPTGKGKDPDAIPLRACANPECGKPYPRIKFACPRCGEEPVFAQRGKPEFVDGDLVELDPETLRLMRGEIARIDGACTIAANDIVGKSIHKNHRNRQEAQRELRREIAVWAGWQKHKGLHDREATKLFFFLYGVDIMGAQTLGATEAALLQTRISADLSFANVVAA